MAKVEVIITEEKLKLPSGTQEKIAQRQLFYLEAQASAGIDGDGRPMVGKDGAKLDLHDSQSGGLWQSRSISESPDGAQVTFAKDYARHVFQELGGRFKSLTLSPSYQSRLDADIQPFLNEAYLEEKK